jgi:uncharacterized protein (DUF302 family)
MNMIRNLLAIIGLVALIGGGYYYSKFSTEITAFNELDPQAGTVYAEMWEGLKKHGNSADATVWKVPLEEGVTWEDAEEAMASVANELNLKGVGELPLSDQVKSMTGKDQRFLKIYQFCDPLVAVQMVDHSEAFSAYLPCRISMVEDKQGKFALYALNMDMMIYGGRTLPDELNKSALDVKEKIQTIMKRASEGDF